MGAAALSVRCFSCWAGKARAPRVSRRQKSTSTAVLIDGSDLLHHFHGLSSKKDKLAQNGGLCKFAEFVMRLHRDMPVDYFAVAFDCEGQCWRGETWPSYAALRQTAAEELGPQPRLAAELCKELGVFHERRKGFDAYDLLSTLAADAIMLPHESIVTVVSNQLLAARLVSPRVRLLLPGVGDAALDEDAVVQELGVGPSQMADLVALAGAKGLKGVPQIGRKCAAVLLRAYGDLEAVVAAAAGRRRPEVENAESNFERLITARRWESLKRHGPGVLETRHLLEARRVDGVADFGSLERAESLDVARGASWCRRAGLPALESKVCHLGEARKPAERASGAARARAEASPRGGKGAPARPSRARAEGAFQKGPIVQLPLRGSERSPVVVRSTGDCGPALQALRSSRGRAGRLFAVSCELDRQGEGAGLVCFTVHGGEGVDFGGSSTLWVDAVSISEEVGQPCALACFREFFEDEGYQKIYHNYSSLNSALHQQGVSHLGFAGDTMHMARLWDASLAFLQNDDVSLPKLTSLCLGSEYAQALTEAVIRKKDGKFVQRPLSLQSGAETRGHWIDFAAWAAVCVFHLYRDLRARLEATPCRPLSGAPPGAGTLWEFYDRYWRPFGQVLAAMERRGVGADAAHLRALENDVLRERAVLEAAVRGWAADATSERFGPDAVEGANLHALNTGSDAQIRHLLFGGVANKMRRQGSLPDEKVLPGVAPPAEEAGPAEAPSAALEGPPAPAGDGGAAAADYSQLKLPELKELLKSRGLMVSGTKAALVERLLLQDQGHEQKMAPRGKPKAPSVRIRGLRLGLKAIAYTEAGWPSVSGDVLRAMAKQQGTAALERQGAEREGALGPESVAAALERLAELRELDGQLDFFLRPLQDHVQADGRIRSCLNLNTETGRLSSRDPNLQNQPAGSGSLVRKAFVAAEGNALVVADYAQLELRVLAHLAGCQAWVDALNSGGDFHSKTAAKMFPSVRAAIERGTVRLDKEGDSAGQPLPTVKEAFPLERGRAKTLNFAILYGKTAWGLSQDWGIELGAAQQIIDDWFEAYPEIRQWQARTQDEARQSGGVRTLLGRFRRLPAVRDVLSAQKRNHALRAAINTPVQGSAADIVTLAMLRLASCRYLLHEVGFHMVLQVHDEVVLEGPEARAEDALWQVRRLMEDPLPFGMAARLVVDARTAKNWHDAKPG